MSFQPDRLRGLMRVKGRLKQDELEGVNRALVTKCLNGHKDVSLEDAARLAVALDATTDYLAGLGDDYGGSYEVAAAKMSFAVFERDPKVTLDQKRRCRRVFEHERVLARDGAPRTAKAWKAVAEMVDLATPPPPPRIEVVRA